MKLASVSFFLWSPIFLFMCLKLTCKIGFERSFLPSRGLQFFGEKRVFRYFVHMCLIIPLSTCQKSIVISFKIIIAFQ